MSSAQVLEMNSAAVSLLVQGKHDVSHFTLQKALESYRQVLNEDEMSVSVNMDDDMEGTSLYTVEIHDAQHKALEQQSMVTVYNRAFVLTTDQAEQPFVSDNEHTVPAVLLYNMGLSHHIQAMSVGSSALLRKALQLYSMSFSLLEHASGALNDMDISVLLALSNNMGVISSSQFYDRPAAESSRAMMERILGSSDCLDCLEDEDIEFFSLNLMFLSEFQNHALAPAA